MTAQTAAYHCPTELQFMEADDLLNIVHFAAPSKSAAHKVNLVGLDIITGETFCTCKGAECGLECWHQTLVRAAWEGHTARVLASRYTADQLTVAGRKALAMCTIYRRRCGRCLPADQVALLAARCEYRARRGVVVSAVAA